ncbi:MAG TPA: hypothetical protein PK239_19220, partial [Chitinophagales bacterium]|nr:hypothetical protein [Chitinophagales bacterium]
LTAQNKYFEKTYGWTDNHTGMSITSMDNGNYLISCGFFVVGNDTNSSALLSIMPNGNLDFLQLYLEDGYENIVRKVIKSNDGYFLAGWSRTFPPNPQMLLYLLQTDNNGNKIFSTSIKPDDYRCGAYTGFRTPDGGYLLGGFIIPYLSSPLYHEPYLVKVDASGQVQWTHIYNNYVANNWIQDMLPAENGGAYLLLQTNYWSGGGDIALLKIDSAGNIIWEQTHNFNPYPGIPEAAAQQDRPRTLRRTMDGGFLITALIDTIVSAAPNIGLYQYWPFGATYKTDSLGNVLWMTFEHNGRDVSAHASCVLSDNSYVICGSRLLPTSPGAWTDQIEIELFKLDAQGNTLWTRYYGGEYNDYAFDMLPTPDGGFILCGRKEYYNVTDLVSTAQVYVIKTNCMGLLTQPQAAFTHYPI